MVDYRARGRVQGSPDVTAFAISSIDSIRDIARDIIESGDQAAKSFCRNLRSALNGVKTELERPNQSQDEAHLEKVKSLLKNLERLCNWPRSNQQILSYPWPTLRAILLRSGPSKENARKCLRALAVNPEPEQKKYRADVIKKLGNYSAATRKQEAAEAAQNNDASATSPAPHKSHELDEDIQSLYKILKQYRSCQNGPSPSDIAINLRLNGYRSLAASSASVELLVENASAEFGVLLLDHPHENRGFWQEASIQTCPTIPPNPEVPTIQVTDEDVAPGAMDTLATAAIAEHDCIPLEGFCERISKRDQDLLRLSTRDDKLVYHRRGHASHEWLAHIEAVPLASLFSRPDLNLLDKSKAILAMLAAKATWDFYDSDLLAQGLTSGTVQFICEKRFGITGVFINEPMLLAQYTEKDGTSTGYDKSDNRSTTPSTETIHDMPRILALGIFLLELETRKPMKKHRKNPRVCPPRPFGINTDYQIACKLVATGPNANESIIPDIEPLSPLRKILPLCITPGSLERKIRENLSARGSAKSAFQVNEQNALRSVIYSELVRPLEDWAKRYDDIDHIKPLYEVSDAPAGPRPERPPNQIKTASQANPPANVALDNKHNEDKKSGYKAVKIAVLDTGISQDIYNHYRCYPGALKYKDFTDTAPRDQDTIIDSTGHGSAAVLLLDEMCPNATYCIAKVLENNFAKQADASLIAKGIDWAISQKVDIITMALGFKVEQHAVAQAVRRAHTEGILIFSAASNKRGLEDMYCPANMIEEVFGIFSTDAGNYPSRSLNPAPLPESFAVFGEDVEVEECSPLRKGTSYSTSIAAGLAAALLDFSRQDRDEDDGSILSQLGSRPYMRSVFRGMAKENEKYLCLRPWSLLKSEDVLAAAPKKVPRDQQRAWIQGTIERLLQPDMLRRAG